MCFNHWFSICVCVRGAVLPGSGWGSVSSVLQSMNPQAESTNQVWVAQAGVEFLVRLSYCERGGGRWSEHCFRCWRLESVERQREKSRHLLQRWCWGWKRGWGSDRRYLPSLSSVAQAAAVWLFVQCLGIERFVEALNPDPNLIGLKEISSPIFELRSRQHGTIPTSALINTIWGTKYTNINTEMSEKIQPKNYPFWDRKGSVFHLKFYWTLTRIIT